MIFLNHKENMNTQKAMETVNQTPWVNSVYVCLFKGRTFN